MSELELRCGVYPEEDYIICRKCRDSEANLVVYNSRYNELGAIILTKEDV